MTKLLLIGASRGIGLEWATQACAEGFAVSATARDAAGLERLRARGATAIALDTGQAESVADFLARLGPQRFDQVVLNAGVYGPQSQGLEPPSADEFDAVMHVNVLAAMRLLPALGQALAPDARVAVISSRMGSIGERSSTSGWLYRASKAALNSVLKDASIAWEGRAVCVALHPGWVRTDMGGAGADLAPEESVASLRRLLAGLAPADNGRFLDHDGSPIAW